MLGFFFFFALNRFSFFKECPHPDEKQRSDLSKRLGLENKQVKFWFQNRRTQMKVNWNTLVFSHLCGHVWFSLANVRLGLKVLLPKRIVILDSNVHLQSLN